MKLSHNILWRAAATAVLLALFAPALSCHAPQPPASSLPAGTLPPAATSQPMEGQTASGPPILPDPNMTPGDTFQVTKDDVCVSGYTKTVRDVPSEVKRQVYQEYGITSHAPGEYEVDHLISLELGGSNDIKNLWPQSYHTQPWNAHVKDKLENELHREVCSGQIDLSTAQQEIAHDWIAAYKQVFHTDAPLAEHSHSRRSVHEDFPAGTTTSPSASVSSDLNAQVWVNTRSGAFWRPGTRYYGKTREGQYISEAEALRQGYHPAGEVGNRE